MKTSPEIKLNQHKKWEPVRFLFFVTWTTSALLVACASPTRAERDDCAHKIGLVSGVAGVNDNGINEASWMGIVAGAEALGLREGCYGFLVARNEADAAGHIETFVAEGFDIVATTELSMQDPTRTQARLNPEVRFIGIGQHQRTPDGTLEPVENLAGLVFREEEQGFMAGVVAGMATESGVVGGVFGCEISPPVLRYQTGYQNGARHANPDVEVIVVGHPGSVDICYEDADYGAILASGLVERDADVIFASGGRTARGALVVACETGAWVIGTSFDQFEAPPAAQGCILTSVTWDVTTSVRDLLVGIDQGTFTSGEVWGEVGLAPYHSFDNVLPDGTRERLAEVQAALENGEIDPCTSSPASSGCPSGQ